MPSCSEWRTPSRDQGGMEMESVTAGFEPIPTVTEYVTAIPREAVLVDLAARGLIDLGPPNGGVGLCRLPLVLGFGVCGSIGTGTSAPFARFLVGKTIVKVVVEAVEFGHLIVDAIVLCAPFHGYGVCRAVDMGARAPFDGLHFGEAIAEAFVVGCLIVGAIAVGPLVVRVFITHVVSTEDSHGQGGSCRAFPGTSLPGSGSGSAGSAADGQAPVARYLVDLRFHNFLPLFC